MVSIVTKASKGGLLTAAEMDANLNNLNNGKQELLTESNLKTINSTSLLNSGDIALVTQAQYDADIGGLAAALATINGV